MSTLGVSSHPTTRLRTISSRRYRRGAGALVAVLLLAALAGTGLAAHYAAQHAARQTAQAFEAGWVFAAWVLSVHRASQELDYSVRLAVEPAFVLTPATLRGVGTVPPGLPARAGRDTSFVVGIMDDGAGVPGRSPVAMAFGVAVSHIIGRRISQPGACRTRHSLRGAFPARLMKARGDRFARCDPA